MAQRTPAYLRRPVAFAVGSALRKRRNEQKLSQERLAELSGFHRTQIGFIERGERNPNVETVVVAARALNMRASDLLREAGY